MLTFPGKTSSIIYPSPLSPSTVLGVILQRDIESTRDFRFDDDDDDNDGNGDGDDDDEACNVHEDGDDKHCSTVVAAEPNHAILAPDRRSNPDRLHSKCPPSSPPVAPPLPTPQLPPLPILQICPDF